PAVFFHSDTLADPQVDRGSSYYDLRGQCWRSSGFLCNRVPEQRLDRQERGKLTLNLGRTAAGTRGSTVGNTHRSWWGDSRNAEIHHRGEIAGTRRVTSVGSNK